MGVDRGLGNLQAVFTVSGLSVNWDEVIEWYLDGPGSSFKEGGEFVPGPTFRERVPRQRRHILAGVPFSKGVVTSHKPSSSFMDFFYCYKLQPHSKTTKSVMPYYRCDACIK